MKSTKSKIVGALLLLTFIGTGIFFYFKFKEPPITYKKATVSRGDMEVTVLATGTVQPENRLEIKSPVGGRVEQILVNEGDKVRRAQIIAWISSSERAALIDAARAQGTEEVKKWEEMYKPTPIIAPIAGTIILRRIETGQTFTTSDAILVMSDRLTVKAQVDETDLAQIRLKQVADIRLDAYPNEKIPAIVDQIAFEAKTVNNVTTYLITVLPGKAPEFMRSGMTANVKFFVNSKKDILLIPNEFLKYQNGKPFAVVPAEGPNQTQEKQVELGTSDGKQSEVLSGLNEGDTILMAQVGRSGAKKTNPFSMTGGGGARGRGGGR